LFKKALFSGISLRVALNYLKKTTFLSQDMSFLRLYYCKAENKQIRQKRYEEKHLIIAAADFCMQRIWEKRQQPY
jgi:hypothetical protein